MFGLKKDQKLIKKSYIDVFALQFFLTIALQFQLNGQFRWTIQLCVS